jgi:hypothetical protein
MDALAWLYAARKAAIGPSSAPGVARRHGGADSYSGSADSVLHSETWPELKPFMNQRLRCSEVPILIRFWKGIGIVRRNLFWLSDEQWERIEPHLPTDVP